MLQHHQVVQALSSRQAAQRQLTRREQAREEGESPELDQEETNSFFRKEHAAGSFLKGGQVHRLKHRYREQMYELDQAAGDAEKMKITGSIHDIIPTALYNAMNRQNVISGMRSKVKGFPHRVFGHAVDHDLKLPSDEDVIKENSRMLSGLELAAGYRKQARTPGKESSSDGWGEHDTLDRRHHGWSSSRWLGGAKDVQDEEEPSSDDSPIPVLSDGWGQHDFDQESKSGSVAGAGVQGLASWKQQLKSSESRMGFRGLMAEQKGYGTQHTELADAQDAAKDGWLR